jgi:CotH kinase protein/Lamin Tail Domain/Secretion system C-terminal sorting domain
MKNLRSTRPFLVSEISRPTIFFALFFILFQTKIAAQILFDPTQIVKIEIEFPTTNWDFRLDTSEAGADNFTFAKSVKINGTKLDSVGVKWRGNTTFDAAQAKNPLHIELNTFVSGQNFEGQNDLYLNNEKADPAFLREGLGYFLLQNYMDVARAGFAEVLVNGQFLGLYTLVEEVGTGFVKDHFGSSKGAFFKCSPENPGVSNLSNLAYLGPQEQLYYAKYEKRAVNDLTWKELVALCDTLKNFSAAIPKILDVDRCLWMHSANAALVNLNSYTGGFSENYYVFRDEFGRFSPIPFDFSESFGGFALLDPPTNLSISQLAQLPVATQETNTKRPLIQQLLADARFRKMYVAHFRTIVAEQITTGNYENQALAWQALLSAKFTADPNKFYTAAQFSGALTTNNSSAIGGATVPGISNLMDDRLLFLQNSIDFQKIPPVLSNPAVSVAQPILGASVFISIKTTGAATAAFLGFQQQKFAPFTRIPMFDDGQHGDGAANDGTFGVAFLVDEPTTRYYFWVENNDAGAFLPARAEHEFLKLEAQINALAPKSVVINEVMSNNMTGATDQNGQFDDWIELHNRTNADINLSRCYLTNKLNDPTRWKIPDGTTISAGGYLTIWADNDPSQAGLHTNFTLTSIKDQVKLTDEALVAADSVEFADQIADISWARIPNGTGPFQYQNPTFNANNSPDAVTDIFEKNSLDFYPNPANDIVYFSKKLDIVSLYNSLGIKVLDAKIGSENSLKTDQLPRGIYFLKSGNLVGRLVKI